jgi:hypothetical protein
MAWKIVEAPVGAKACDAYESVTAAQAKSLRADGFEAIGRYVEGVTQQELEWLTAAGLGVWFIIEGLASGTAPSAALGGQMVSAGLTHLHSLGVPSGVTVFGDLEGDGRASSDWIAFGNAEADAISTFKDIPGGYIGEGIGLTSRELYALRFVRYWKSGSRVVDRFDELAEPACGWAAIQGIPFDIARPDGLQIDVDALWRDYRGRAITLLVAA